MIVELSVDRPVASAGRRPQHRTLRGPPNPEGRPTFLFNDGTNTIGEAPAIAWVYGKEVFIGSNVVSASIIAEQIGPAECR